jgi:hypothetical protein
VNCLSSLLLEFIIQFIGMVADDPDNKIELKTFHCEIINDHDALKKEADAYKEISVFRKIDNS